MSRLAHLVAIVCLLSTTFLLTHGETACSKALEPKIVDVPELNKMVEQARARFLSTRPHPFTRCDITVLLPQKDGTIHRASYNQNGLGYPASTVKLTFLVSAIEWCLKQNKPYDCLDAHVRPMIYTSDNFETGVVVDFITGSTNYPESNAQSPTFKNWWQKRNFTTEYFANRGLLENQILLSKTYPTNSGLMPNGAEQVLRDVAGMNSMKPKCAASLMAEIALGIIHPTATKYMLGMLQHARYSYSAIGMGTPPGSILYNKIGNAYDTLNEIAYIVLPDGYGFVMAVYTNGLEPGEPDTNNLSFLTETVIDALALSRHLPPKYIYDSGHTTRSGTGWSTSSEKRGYYTTQYWQNSGAPGAWAAWTVNLPAGLYEVSIWHPEGTELTSTTYRVTHAHGMETYTQNQRYNGGRWMKLGDMIFENNKPAIVNVTNPGRAYIVDSVKFNLWPSCNGIPGTQC